MRLSRVRAPSRRGTRHRRKTRPPATPPPPAEPAASDKPLPGSGPRYRIVRRDGEWVAELRPAGDGKRTP